MAGLAWFELDTDFHDDPKIRALASRLREPLADSYVSRLYAYCYKHVTDRFPAESAADTIEEVCRWKGRRRTLVDALFAVGVLERGDNSMTIVHGVKDRLAPHVAAKVGASERQRKHREKLKAARDGNVTVTRDVTSDVTAPSRSYIDRDIDSTDTEAASATGTRPIAVHLAGQCPDLAALLKRSAVAISVGHKATLWGEADAIVRRVGAEAVEACWVAVAAKRGGGSVPLAYLIHPMRDLEKRGARGSAPVSSDFQTKTKADLDAEAKALGFHVTG